MSQHDLELALPDGSTVRCVFTERSCWVEVRVVNEEFAPSRTTFSDSLSPDVGRAMVARALEGGSLFEECGHPVMSCSCFLEAPEAEYVAGASETGFGASPVPAVEFEWPTTQFLPMQIAHASTRWWLARPKNVDHPLLKG